MSVKFRASIRLELVLIGSIFMGLLIANETWTRYSRCIGIWTRISTVDDSLFTGQTSDLFGGKRMEPIYVSTLL